MRFIPALVASLFATTAAARAADASTCTPLFTGERVEYWTKTNPVANSTRCDWAKDGTSSCHWYGWLFKPSSTSNPTVGNLPAVVFVHGSGQTKSKGTICEITNDLVSQGYVVFMPYMRGVDDTSPVGTGHGFHNTGKYIEDYAAQGGATGDAYVLNTLSYMEWEAQDEVQFALTKLTSLTSGDGTKPLVKSTKIALWGHSYGGAVVNIATGTGLTPQPAATIDLSGAVMSWAGSIYWAIYMDSYAGAALNPIYFQQTVNESPSKIVTSTLEPFTAANNGGQQSQMSVFHNHTPDSDTQTACNAAGTPQYQCVHNAFVYDHDGYTRWIGTVSDFMTRHGVKP